MLIVHSNSTIVDKGILVKFWKLMALCARYYFVVLY